MDSSQFLQNWKSLLSSVGSTADYHASGTPLSDEDKRTFSHALVTHGVWLEESSHLSDGLHCGPSEETIRWLERLRSVNVTELGLCLSLAIKQLRNIYVAEWTERSFHRYLGGGRLLKNFLEPVRKDVSSLVQDVSCVTAFRRIHQHLCFLSRITLDTGLETQALEKYVAFQATETVIDFSLAYNVRAIIHEWLRGFCITSPLPVQHGPGATYETPRGSTAGEKYNSFFVDARLHHYIIGTLGHKYSDYALDGLSLSKHPRVSRVIFVPKGMTSRRTISAEPAVLQFFQQGLMKALYQWLESTHSPILKHYNPYSTERNVVDARVGSYDGWISTIDLSAASDSVTWDLVRYLFSGTGLYPGMFASRSTHAELPTGEVIPQRSFAPMGSSLCFPVETIVFCAICEHCYRTLRLPYQHEFHVYGDDITCDSRATEMIMDSLVKLGFSPNVDKSFYRTTYPYFRESCGAMYFNGQDVSPIFFSRRFRVDGKQANGYRDASSIEGRINFVNTLFNRGLPQTRRFALSTLLDELGREIPLFSDSSEKGVMSLSPTNLYARRFYKFSGPGQRWNPYLETWSVSSKETGPLIESDRDVYEWLRVAELRRLPDWLNPVIEGGVQRHRRKLGWTRGYTSLSF